MEEWNVGRLEDWKGGRLDGRMEGWKDGWKIGRLECWRECMEDLVLSGYVEKREYDTGRQGVCVQIGLHNVAEYLYLARPNWKEVMGELEVLKQIPAVVADRWTSWRYYGVDSDVGSIQKMLEIYGSVSTACWVHASVGVASDQLMWLPSYFAQGRFIGFACSLQRLFALLNLSQVDVLAIDVEGDEIGIFENYDWGVKPSFISVEVHGDHGRTSVRNAVLLNRHINIVDKILTGNGYQQVNKVWTNFNTTGYCTCEVQYRR